MPSDSKLHPSDPVSGHFPVPLIRAPEQPEKLVRIMGGTVTLAGLALLAGPAYAVLADDVLSGAADRGGDA